MQLYKESFAEHNFLWTQWKKLKHFSYLHEPKKVDKEQNLSNCLKVYAKIENNQHLSNKFALFHNMRKYYLAIGRDPFDVLPLTFHIRGGTADIEFIKFLDKHQEFVHQR